MPTSDDGDHVVEANGKRIRIPGALAANIPQVVNFAFGARPDGQGDVFLFFVTDDPTVEEIASEGVERVATIGMSMRVSRFEEFVGWANGQLDELRGRA